MTDQPAVPDRCASPGCAEPVALRDPRGRPQHPGTGEFCKRHRRAVVDLCLWLDGKLPTLIGAEARVLPSQPACSFDVARWQWETDDRARAR